MQWAFKCKNNLPKQLLEKKSKSPIIKQRLPNNVKEKTGLCNEKEKQAQKRKAQTEEK